MTVHRFQIVSRTLAALGLAALCLSGGLSRSEEQAGGEENVAALVKQLGAQEFAVRDTATRRLWKMGNAALPALREACASEDPEVSARARKIVANLELGIQIDTPAETVALVREFHAGNLKQKEAVLRRLRGDDQLLLRIRLLLAEENPEWREKMVREFAGTGDVILEALRESKSLEEADELLAILSPRSWAVHLLFDGRAEARQAKLSAEWNGGKGSADPAQLFWLLVVTDKLEEARAVAEQCGEPSLRREACLRQGDWVGLLKVEGDEIGENPVEKLGFKAWFLSRAGEEEKAQAAVDELAELKIEDERMARNRAVSLLLLGRFEQAEKNFERLGELDRNEFSILHERFQFEKLFARLGVDPAAKDLGKELGARIDKILKDEEGNKDRNRRRERFYLATSVAELLMNAGEKEEAGKVVLATLELIREEPAYLSSLALSCRRMGLAEEAEAIGLEALEAGQVSSYLGARFPYERTRAQLWWDYYRGRHPDEPVKETLRRVTAGLEAEEGEVPAAEVLEWVENGSAETRAKHYGALAEHYRKLQQWDKATEYFRKQSELSEKAGAPLIEAGNMFADEKRWNEAAAFYAEAAEKERGNELAVFLHGHALVEGGEREAGEARKAAALRMPLANSRRRNTFAYALRRRGLTEAAQEQWRLLVKTAVHDDWDGSTFWALRTARSQLVSSIATENPALAADYLEAYLMSFLKTNTSMTPRYYLLYRARIHGYRFEASIAAGAIDAAIQHVRSAFTAWPGSTNLAIKAGERLTEAGRPEVADEIYESLAKRHAKILETFPNSGKHHNSLAWLAGRSGRDLELALAHAKSAVRLVPDHAEYLDTLAEVEFRLGNREEAIRLAKRCLELDPDVAQYQEQLKRFEAEQGEEPM